MQHKLQQLQELHKEIAERETFISEAHIRQQEEYTRLSILRHTVREEFEKLHAFRRQMSKDR